MTLRLGTSAIVLLGSCEMLDLPVPAPFWMM